MIESDKGNPNLWGLRAESNNETRYFAFGIIIPPRIRL